jgi:hypothetical protein
MYRDNTVVQYKQISSRGNQCTNASVRIGTSSVVLLQRRGSYSYAREQGVTLLTLKTLYTLGNKREKKTPKARREIAVWSTPDRESIVRVTKMIFFSKVAGCSFRFFETSGRSVSTLV